MKSFWQSLGRSARVSLVVGVLVILSIMGTTFWWVLRPNYQVLFSDLKPQDAAAMTTELEKLKVPYSVDDNGSVILVDKSLVHATRIKLMGKDLPLHGAVGFELFNNTDFGMTEFAQKINYQRALQGELTRTILSLSEIRDVRVHLALPEQGLFKQANAKPKAAITLTLHEGQSLRPEQVSGIQRLVAAATPGMTAQDVTMLDKQGVALSRLAENGSDDVTPSSAGNGNTRLELKNETEAQLVRKASAVLDKAFGPGQALASVDVTLNMDQVRTTTEDVIPAPSRTADSKGVIVKERESVRDGNTPPLDQAKSAGAGAGGSTQREVDYQVGRRVEQVVSSAGAVRRIQVVAVVRQAMDSAQEEQLRRILAAAVGASPERGDTVVVQSLQAWSHETGPAAPGIAALQSDAQAAEPKVVAAPSSAVVPQLVTAIVALAVVVVAIGLLIHALRRRPIQQASTKALSPMERQAALQRVHEWLQHEPLQGAAPSNHAAGAAHP